MANIPSSAYYTYLNYMYENYPVLTKPYVMNTDGTELMENDANTQFYQDAKLLYWLEYNTLVDSENILWQYFVSYKKERHEWLNEAKRNKLTFSLCLLKMKFS